MEAQLESELKKKLISECLKWELELNRLKKEWRGKKEKNLQIKLHNKVLNDKLVVLRRRMLNDGDYQKVINVKECRVVLRNKENCKEIKLVKTGQQIHKNHVISSSDKKFKCQHPGCEKEFTKKRQLSFHVIVHTKKYQCQVCQKCFSLPSQLQIHIRTHIGERPFECDWAGCGKKFKQNQHLKSHVITKHTDKRLFQCKEDGCGKWFKTNNKLQNHVKRHSSLRLYQCQVDGCDKRFKSKGGLKRHVEFVHNKERLFKCDKKNCDGVFQSQAGLNQHAISHLSIRLFQCQECESSYKYKQDLRNHVLIKHSNSSNDLRCDFECCRKTFKTRKLLKRHKKIIHG